MGNTFSSNVVDRLAPTGVVIEEAQVVVHEGHEPNSIADFLDPHVLTGEGACRYLAALGNIPSTYPLA